MLALRPHCELCAKALPPAATDAMICTYECTFCADCVQQVLLNVCPNCGGGFTPRPIRPKTAWRAGVSVADHPPASEGPMTRYSHEDIRAFAAKIEAIPPEDR